MTTQQMMYHNSSVNAVETGATQGFFWMLLLLYVVVIIYSIVIHWKVFTKAGQAGWAMLIPVYNAYIFLRIVNRPWWWLLLYFIPLVNIIIGISVSLDLGKAFGKNAVWSIFLIIFFPLIGMSILAFSNVQYVKPTH